MIKNDNFFLLGFIINENEIVRRGIVIYLHVIYIHFLVIKYGSSRGKGMIKATQSG